MAHVEMTEGLLMVLWDTLWDRAMSPAWRRAMAPWRWWWVSFGFLPITTRALKRAPSLTITVWRDPGLHSMQAAMALAHFTGGDYEAALVWADKVRGAVAAIEA